MAEAFAAGFSRVRKGYRLNPFRRDKRPAVQDLSLRLAEGEVFGIVGPNGAGKSTTIKILMGFIRPDAGEVEILGRAPSDPEVHAEVGYLPENPCLYEHLTAREHLRFAARITGMRPREARARIDEILERVDLLHAADKPVRSYSKGMTQRAALAYALVHDPRLLVLDEPMSGLDPLGRHLVVEILQEASARGKTILFCSHILTDVERFCTRIGIMNRGRLVAEVTPGELKHRGAGVGAETAAPGAASPLEAFFLEVIRGNRP
ncbi:ABC transporter ATP-binding protein [Dissulfurirhabdus thermomarina]|uniref:ABC transporter ATP-binding protein n=1 Tax=Dissulfurirhabdus thermomarina TaxID=1765737 RepID=A0A6N9TSK0_DISTH|nr:ABC transporter ATP-binding protein [Dissulfurirhabdus thermomarina]NDY42724.1 ABC transporter ATP-binding protein [Dissulfurirhabdus thermomarina]NMX23636.1 ABC transporter ATP-binding protein [Dissulfurirhabdus thermomarina]